jgi:hypothetical protein
MHVAFYGMDVSDLRQRAAHLNQLAAATAELSVKISHAFDGATWVGPDATSAQKTLQQDIFPALRAIREQLSDIALQMNVNAAEQESVSAQ